MRILCRTFLKLRVKGPAEANEEANQSINWRTGGNGTQDIRLFRTAAEITQVPDITADLYNRIALR